MNNPPPPPPPPGAGVWFHAAVCPQCYFVVSALSDERVAAALIVHWQYAHTPSAVTV